MPIFELKSGIFELLPVGKFRSQIIELKKFLVYLIKFLWGVQKQTISQMKIFKRCRQSLKTKLGSRERFLSIAKLLGTF